MVLLSPKARVTQARPLDVRNAEELRKLYKANHAEDAKRSTITSQTS
jgi:hypothetical protein